MRWYTFLPDVQAAGAFPSKRHLLCTAAPTKYQNLLHPSPDSVGLDVGELTPQHKKGGRRKGAQANCLKSKIPHCQNGSKYDGCRGYFRIKHLNSATYAQHGFFPISLTEKVRPNGSREVDERVKLHIWTTFEQNLPMDPGDNPRNVLK